MSRRRSNRLSLCLPATAARPMHSGPASTTHTSLFTGGCVAWHLSVSPAWMISWDRATRDLFYQVFNRLYVLSFCLSVSVSLPISHCVCVSVGSSVYRSASLALARTHAHRHAHTHSSQYLPLSSYARRQRATMSASASASTCDHERERASAHASRDMPKACKASMRSLYVLANDRVTQQPVS